MKDIEFDEENKLWNWYMGLSIVGIWRHSFNFEFTRHSLPDYKTKATSGHLKTPFYRQTLKRSEFYLGAEYSFNIENVLIKCSPDHKLVLSIFCDTKETFGGSERVQVMQMFPNGSKVLAVFEKSGPLMKKFEFWESTAASIRIIFKRRLALKQFEEWKSKRNTGLEIKWYFTNKDNHPIQVQPDHRPLKSAFYRKFNGQEHYSKIVNLYSVTKNPKKFMNIVHKVRREMIRHHEKYPVKCGKWETIEESAVETNLKTLEHDLILDKINLTGIGNNTPTMDDLQNSADVMFYLINCPNTRLSVLRQYLKKTIANNNVPLMIMTINKFNAQFRKKGMEHELGITHFLLEQLTEFLMLKHVELGIILFPINFE